MKIIPLAFDSFGARSMATFIEAETSVVIDPGVALGPSRYGLPPHPLEYQRESELWDKIKKYVAKADVSVITHYHYDHHNPNEVEIFRGKKLLIKHPKERINFSQKKRAAFFLNQLKGITDDIDYADGKRYEFDGIELTISKPVFHGTNDRLGYVIEVCIDDGKQRFLFSSDVEGPAIQHQLDFMLECNAETVFIDGPMTYMLGYRYSAKSLSESIKNLTALIERTNVKTLVLDHHLARDLKWRERLKDLFEKANEAGARVCSAAEFAGIREEMLEALRKELYARYPVK
ncbi:hypothetical protein [Archaeoglobus veneficus]|uniref:UPF0282 protein Arcve_0375 n=1 Tax=Archaeoglobus veneficus (strain DSM 11195 / SNP6) TaxID=693661 RepID=F2KPH7_ARCVS|nr:hypothetical protein [Archaeoglobus veneficus]AEA46408.1 UPF0282 protein [Archaeoglobus veneficus SNP6]